MSSITLTLPKPYPEQRAILNSDATFRGVLFGRRAGKTHLAAQLIVMHLMKHPHANILYGAARAEQTRVVWRYLKSWLTPLMKTNLVTTRLNPREIRFGERGAIFVTASDPDSLRGDGPTLIVLDEAAYIPQETYEAAVLPMMADPRAERLILLSSPSMGSWVNQLYLLHQQTPTRDWAWWNMPTGVNPYITPDKLTRLSENMTEDMYRQEIQAEVLGESGGVFRHIGERCTASPREPYAGRFMLGVDWAKTTDYTVITCLDVDTRTMVDIDRFTGVDWSLTRGRVRAMVDKWQPIGVIAETNSFGDPNVEALQADGLPIIPFTTTAQSKPPLIESLVLAFDRGEITCLDDMRLRSELMMFQRTVGTTGRSQYAGTSGGHDDMVMSLAFAWHGVMQHAMPMTVVGFSW